MQEEQTFVLDKSHIYTFENRNNTVHICITDVTINEKRGNLCITIHEPTFTTINGVYASLWRMPEPIGHVLSIRSSNTRIFIAIQWENSASNTSCTLNYQIEGGEASIYLMQPKKASSLNGHRPFLKTLYSKYKLEFKQSLAYITDYLSGGGALSEYVLQIMDFSKGSFYTFFHCPIDLQHLHKFTQGGIVPYTGSDVLDTSLAHLVFQILQSKGNLHFLFEDVLHNKEDKRESELFPYIHTYKEQLLLLLNKETPFSLYDVIQKQSSPWHYLGLIADVASPQPLPKELSSEFMQGFCKNTSMLITQAYDLEGYVFWIKNMQFVEILDETLHLCASQHRR